MSQETFIKNMVNVWGMSQEESEIAIKKAKIDDLLIKVNFVPFEQFFDSNSDKLLDEKIKVLTALQEGKTISDIPNFFDILELYPKDGTYWD
jgi:hypothetical protein